MTEMAVLPADPRQWQAWLSESAQRDGATWQPGTGQADVTVSGPARRCC
jgi:hypothetical protein